MQAPVRSQALWRSMLFRPWRGVRTAARVGMMPVPPALP